MAHHRDFRSESVPHVFPGIARVLIGLVAIVLMPFAFSQQSIPGNEIQPGHSGGWYNPSRPGEGWVLEVTTPQNATLYWYTFENGKPLWMVGNGSMVTEQGRQLLRFNNWRVRGPQFGAAFDPDALEYQLDSQIAVWFDDCSRGGLSYRGRLYPIQRLSGLLGLACGSTAAENTPVYAYQSGSWYDPSHDGEGYSLHWWAPDQALVTWYTYSPDGSGDPVWIVGAGHREGNRVVFPELFTASGAQFGSAFDPDDVQIAPWGRLEFTLGCETGTATYEGPVAYGSGERQLRQISSPTGLECSPALGEVFDVDFQSWDIPLAQRTALIAVTDEGKAFAVDSSQRLIRMDVTNREPEVLSDQPVGSIVGVSPDGQQVLVNSPIDVDPSKSRNPVLWSASTGVRVLDLPFANTQATVTSDDFSTFAGYVYAPDNTRRFWYYSDLTGGVELLNVESALTAVSNDASIVYWSKLVPYSFASGGGSVYTGYRWQFPYQRPYQMYDDAQIALGPVLVCANNCATTFGVGQADDRGAPPFIGEVWRGRNGKFDRYLGSPPDLDATGANRGRLYPNDVSTSGSLLVGNYFGRLDANYSNFLTFLWTQETGTVSLYAELRELGLIDDDWAYFSVGKLSLSPSGNHLLIYGAGRETDTNGNLVRYREGVVTLRRR